MTRIAGRIVLTLGVSIFLVTQAQATQTFLGSTFSKQSTSAEFLTELDTTIIVTTVTESWFALVNARVTNTTGQIVTVTMTLRESLLVVADETVTLSLAPGTSTVQLPKQYQGSDLGVGPHTFRVRVNQNTNSPINYQVQTYLGLFNNTGTGGVPAGGGDVVGPASSIDRRIPVFDGVTGKLLADNGAWLIPTTGTLTGVLSSTSTSVQLETGVCQGAKAGGHTCTSINEISTSATAGAAFVGQAITVGGANIGAGSQNVGAFYNVTNGTINTAVYALAGDVVLGTGKIANENDTTPDAFLDLASSAADVSTLMLLTAAGTTATGYDAAVIANGKTGGLSGTFNSALSVTTDGVSAGRNVGIMVNVTNGAEANVAFLALSGTILTLSGDLSTIDGTMGADQSNSGSNAMSAGCSPRTGAAAPCHRVNVVGDGTAGAKVGIEAIVDGGGSPADSLGLKVTASNANNVEAAQFICTASGGSDDCVSIAATNDGTGTIGSLAVTTDGGGGGLAVGLTLAATNAATKRALDVEEGDVNFGTLGILEDLHWNQANSQFIVNVDVGTATDVGTNTMELHNDLGEIGLQIYVTGSGAAAGAGIAVTSTGVVTSASSGNVFSNTQTSSTSSINKTAGTFSSTGAWSGSGAINAGAVFSASGGTINYGTWVQQGGTRNAAQHVGDPQSETCAAGGGACTLTLAVLAENVWITCQDVDSCDITMGETAIADGTCVKIVCLNDGAGAGKTCDFADTSGVSELAGAVSLDLYDSLSLCYVSDRWVETARSNN